MENNTQVRYRRNPLLRFTFNDGVSCEALLTGAVFEVHSPAVFQVIRVLEENRSRAEILELLELELSWPREEVELLLAELLEAGVVLPESAEVAGEAAAKHWEQRGWLDALLLHLASKNISYFDADKEQSKLEGSNAVSFPSVEAIGPWEHLESIGALEISLPQVDTGFIADKISEILLVRRSGRQWSSHKASIQEMSGVLCFGNLDSVANRKAVRAPDLQLQFDSSSWRAIESYVVVNAVEGIPPGVYGYDCERHTLIQIRSGEQRQRLVAMCIGQRKVEGCSFAVIMAAKWRVYYSLYRHPRAYRNLLVNVGEFCQRYLAAATAYGLSNFITPAFNDEVACEITGTDEVLESALYMAAFG